MILMGIAIKISQIMTKEIISVDSKALVSEAASIMVRNEVGAVVVTKNSTPVGIITEVDVLKRCCVGKACNKELKAEDIMSAALITIDADAAIGEAARLMSDKRIRRLLVTENEKIIGIVTEKDVLRATLGYFENVLLSI